MPRDGSMGQVVFEEVNRLLASGMKKSEAFRMVAADMLDFGASEEDQEKKARSVATTYYRLQRLAADNDGEAPAPKRRGRPPKAASVQADTTEPAPVAVAEAPKRRGRPPKVKTEAVDIPTVVHGQNGYEADVMTALGQAKVAIDNAIEQARQDARELAELREKSAKLAQLLG